PTARWYVGRSVSSSCSRFWSAALMARRAGAAPARSRSAPAPPAPRRYAAVRGSLAAGAMLGRGNEDEQLEHERASRLGRAGAREFEASPGRGGDLSQPAFVHACPTLCECCPACAARQETRGEGED